METCFLPIDEHQITETCYDSLNETNFNFDRCQKYIIAVKTLKNHYKNIIYIMLF